MLEVQAHNIAPLSNLIISAVQEMTPVSAKEQGNRQYRGKTEKAVKVQSGAITSCVNGHHFLSWGVKIGTIRCSEVLI